MIGPQPVQLFSMLSSGGGLIPLQMTAGGLLRISAQGSDALGAATVAHPNSDVVDPDTSVAAASLSFILGWNQAAQQWQRVVVQDDNSDGQGTSNTGHLSAIAHNFIFNGTSWDRARVANVFKTAVATAAGSTAVWTPAAGKKFRLLAWRMSIAGTLAAAGTQTIQLLDSATIIARAGANVSNVYPSGDTQIAEDYGPKGQLSAVANNVLNISLGTAMATGGVYIDVWGTEE